MPIYDYRCPDCGRVVEMLVRTAGREPAACPLCNGSRLERLPSAGSLVRSRGSVATCCGKDERCDAPPCSSSGGSCCGG
jgi:putative FmdB family regulatory protein